MRAKYILGESVSSYVRHLRTTLTRDADAAAYAQARARRMRAHAEAAELDLRLKKNELHRADDVEFFVTEMVTRARSRILAIPSRLMHSLVGKTNPVEINRLLTSEVELALNELADGYQREEYRRRSEAYLKRKIAEMGQERDGQD